MDAPCRQEPECTRAIMGVPMFHSRPRGIALVCLGGAVARYC